MPRMKDVVVAGHLCLDLFPEIGRGFPPVPGGLLRVGALRVSTGGAVANVGLALHRLGVRVRPVARLGDDFAGAALIDQFQRAGLITRFLARRAKGTTSYSLVISPPGEDRRFLHCSGENDHFEEKDVPDRALKGASLFHFGYPPLMKEMSDDGGRAMTRLFQRARGFGCRTSLDMAMPGDRKGNWREWLRRVLPEVDFFLPSLEEMRVLLRRPGASARALAEELIDLGPSVVGLKLGAEGFYVRSAPRAEALGRGWGGFEIRVPCFRVRVVGTTGSGDCTIAGFLAAVLRGLSPQEAARMAVAVGACSVEAVDAASGIPRWSAVRRRIDAGWRTR